MTNQTNRDGAPHVLLADVILFASFVVVAFARHGERSYSERKWGERSGVKRWWEICGWDYWREMISTSYLYLIEIAILVYHLFM